jgi:hypothetical protein
VTQLRLSQVCPGVHRLATRYWNWYLLEAGGRLTVLDAGLPEDWREFAAALSRLGDTPSWDQSLVRRRGTFEGTICTKLRTTQTSKNRMGMR